MGYEGLTTVDGRLTLELSDWSVPGNPFNDIVRATEALVNAGHFGPYGLVVTPELYSMMHRVHPGTYVLEIAHIREIVTDGVYQSSILGRNRAVLVSTGRQNFDLAVAQDLTVAYLGAENMNHPFRVFESVYLSQRIVVLTPRPGRVFMEIPIPALYPRDENFRTSAEYGGLCRQVAEALAGAMTAGAPS